MLSVSENQDSPLVKLTLAECYLLLAQEARSQSLAPKLEKYINSGLEVLSSMNSEIRLSKKLKADFLYESTFLKKADVKKICMSSLELFNDLEPEATANYYNQAICYLRSGES